MSDREIERNERLHRGADASRSRSRERRESEWSSRSRRDERHRRTRSRKRSSARDQLPSRNRSRSTTSLREQERKLSQERRRLRRLDSEVRRERELLLKRERDRTRRRCDTPKSDASHRTKRNVNDYPRRDRSLVTPEKGNASRDDRNKDPRLMTVDFIEEFLRALKSKAGDRESFSTLTNVIPEFDPLLKEQTINIWLDKVDECSEIYNWTDRQTIHYALPKLTGLAKTWYQGLPTIKHTWAEWRVMLKESFPATENYAELLTDMLNRRVRLGESLEVYYFAKLNLLNRCKIFGKQAVDCLLYGIEDRGVRVGAQAAKFEKPEDVLEFFKTIKSNHYKNQSDFQKDLNRDKRSGDTSANNNSLKSVDSTSSKNNDVRGPITCFNCQSVGHPSFKCPKPILKCTNCNFLGHEMAHCPKLKETRSEVPRSI
ncbi:uncharacterized protein LOC111350855 [Spodoptera litura]|uniref:Uncharacterized protein LOC111350855 n=1 Tax=Spodoptera litura TaxID=69820 RepID=A0A9J7IKP2_SPOLT|nr:uncharacterized protein LOC111350855 [Spodoptera litura]XP_022818324.1 uncharacterized protein LOC111350855 [Spodoptera litura]